MLPVALNSFTILHVNLRGWLSHKDELHFYLTLLPKFPHLIAINETFLDDSVETATLFFLLPTL